MTIALFQDEWKLPQAVGAIDATYIGIIAPEDQFSLSLSLLEMELMCDLFGDGAYPLLRWLL